MMTGTISNGIVILLLLFVQNISGQPGVNNNVVNNAALPQPKPTYDTAGVNFYSPQPGQQINCQQSSNMQQAPISQQPQNLQQPGINYQVKQQYQNPLSDIFSDLHNVRFSIQKPQGANPLPMASCGSKQNFEQAPVQSQNQPGAVNNQQYANQVPESLKPTFTFQFVPASPQIMTSDNQQVTNTIPAQYISNSQMSSQQGPSYYVQSQPTNQQVSSSFQTSSGQGQPIIFTMNPQQPTAGPSQQVVYTLQPTQTSSRSGSQHKAPQPGQANIPSDNPMALLMSQLQSPSRNPDIASILPMLMNSKQERSGGMKTLLPLILNLLSDKGCGCPHCGCPYNNPEPTINGGYSNQKNYSQQVCADAAQTNQPEQTKRVAKIIEESSEVKISRVPKKYKTNVIRYISEEASDEEASDEEDDYEVEDD